MSYLRDEFDGDDERSTYSDSSSIDLNSLSSLPDADLSSWQRAIEMELQALREARMASSPQVTGRSILYSPTVETENEQPERIHRYSPTVRSYSWGGLSNESEEESEEKSDANSSDASPLTRFNDPSIFRPLPRAPPLQVTSWAIIHRNPQDSTRNGSPTSVTATLNQSLSDPDPSTNEVASHSAEDNRSSHSDPVPDPTGDFFRADTWYQSYNSAFLAMPSVDTGKGSSDDHQDGDEDSSDDEVEIITPHAYAPPEVYAHPTNVRDSDLDSEVEVMSFTYDREDDDSSFEPEANKNSDEDDESRYYTDVGDEVKMLNSPAGTTQFDPIDLTESK